MNKFVVAIFQTEAQAYEGRRAMQDLQAEGSLVLYGMAVLTKAADGKVAVEEMAEKAPVHTGLGALIGGLVGLIGGPSGAAVGLGSGTLIGSYSDLFSLGIGEDFLDKVSAQLTPGKSAVVAEVEEHWVIPLDTRMQQIGGTVLRQGRADFEHEQIQQEVSADKAELAELHTEYRQARAEDKAKLKARIDEARAKVDSLVARAKARQERLRRETDAKIKTLEEQRAKAQADAKAMHERRIADLRADYDRRMDKLDRAAQGLDLEGFVV